jgi:hypothetical protein
MWRRGLHGLVLLTLLALAALAGRPAEAAPCPHGRALPASGSVEVARPAPELWLAAAIGHRLGRMASTCCTPSCCVVHCPALLPTAVGDAAAPGLSGRQRPPTGRLAGRSPDDGPWRPPPVVPAR